MSDLLKLSEAIDKFLDYQQVRKGRTVDTINTYRSALGQFLRYTGDIELSHLTIDIIDSYADTLAFCKPKTLKNKLTPIRSFLAYMYSRNHINIRAERVDLPQVKELEANFLDHEEQQRLLQACDHHANRNTHASERERAIISFLIASGLRVSEFINLRVEDVYHRSVLVRNGKGGKTRTSYITPEVEAYLIAYQATITDEGPFWLFPNEDGGRLSRQYIAKLIAQVAKRAGIKKKVSPHTLRHTFATNLLMAGARAEDVQPMMGHTHIRTTQIYMHFTNAYLRGRYDQFTGPDASPVL